MKWDKLEEEEQSSNVKKFENVDDEIIGIYLGFKDWSNANGSGRIHNFADIDDPDNEDSNFIVFGTTALNSKMKRVPIDVPVKIVYLGKKPTKKNPAFKYHDYDVFLGSED